MGEESMHNKPEIIVFAGPNGCGKSTQIEPIGVDDFKKILENDLFFVYKTLYY